jgi:hypothetical protein
METSHVFFFCPGSYRMPCVSDANSKKENSVRHATYRHDALLVAGTVVKKNFGSRLRPVISGLVVMFGGRRAFCCCTFVADL